MNMKYVAAGDTDSTLEVHLARSDGHAACGTRPRSPHRGLDWWYDQAARVWKRMVPLAVNQRRTCLRNGCRS